MSFITKSNATRIIRELDFTKVDEMTGKVYESDINLFSIRDMKRLLATAELYADPTKFVEKKYNKILNIDTLSYVFEGGQPAYHEKLNCTKLISTFKNYEIPDGIKEKGEAEVLKFRRWFHLNKYLVDRPDVYVMRLKTAFGIEANAREINVGNSGIEEVENLNLEQLKSKIDDLIQRIDNYYLKADDKKKFVIDKYKKATAIAYPSYGFKDQKESGYTENALKSFLKKYDETFKRPLKKLLKDYYRVKYNPDLKFEGHLLEQLGFKKCNVCYPNQEIGNND